MKVLMYTTRFYPDPQAGGQSAFVRNLLLALAEKGVEADLATYWEGDGSSYAIGKSRILRIFPLSNKRMVDYILKPLAETAAKRLLEKIVDSYDLLHVHGPTYGFYFSPRLHLIIYKGWKRASRNIPLIYHFHGSLYEHPPRHFSGYNVFERQSIDDAKAADHIVTLTRFTAEIFKKRLPQKRIHVVPIFVEDAFLEEYEELDAYPGVFTVLYVGGKLRYKGYDIVLKVKEMLRGTGIRFKMIGTGLHKIPHKDMPHMYLSSSVLLAPSLREGLPPSILEAQALKRPVIASRVGGVPEIVVHGKTGFLVEPGDVRAIARYILLLRENRDLLAEMGENARRHVKEKFSKERVIEEILRVYREASRGL